MNAYIRSLGAYAPEKVMTNDDWTAYVDTSDDWIFTHTGIRERRIAAPEQAASDLGVQAGLDAFAKAERLSPEQRPISPAEIDLVICATATPDYIGMPSTACIIQDKLGIENAGAMDISAVCSGFIYALDTAKSFVESGSANNVLVVGTEVYSKIINWKDRSTCVLFGDGAGAAVVSANDGSAGPSRIYKSRLAAKGSGAEHLLRATGGTRNPIPSGTVATDETYVFMNGRQVYVFAVQAIIETIRTLLDKNEISFEDLDHVVPHHANRRIVEAACKRSGWPEERFFMNIERFANTSAASIPIAMDEMLTRGLLKRGDKLMTVGFGAGLTFGGNYLVF